jgi:hypothetical protein
MFKYPTRKIQTYRLHTVIIFHLYLELTPKLSSKIWLLLANSQITVFYQEFNGTISEIQPRGTRGHKCENAKYTVGDKSNSFMQIRVVKWASIGICLYDTHLMIEF